MNIFVISDTHFDHYNIIKYCNRPYSSLEDMNEDLILKWNSKVGKNDIVYHLGDLGFFKTYDRYVEIVRQLNGMIKLIKGNHDNFKIIKPIPGKIELFPSFLEIHLFEKNVTLCHYPLRSWNKSNHGSWCLHGHEHYTNEHSRKDFKSKGCILDCSVEGNDYYPYGKEELLNIMAFKNQHENL